MNIISEEIISRVANVLGITSDDVEDMTFPQIIEALVEEFEECHEEIIDVNRNYIMRNELWKQYSSTSIVSRRTFVRRLKQGLDPLEAATKERGKSTGRPKKVIR
jgi:lipoate-protein ligase A